MNGLRYITGLICPLFFGTGNTKPGSTWCWTSCTAPFSNRLVNSLEIAVARSPFSRVGGWCVWQGWAIVA